MSLEPQTAFGVYEVLGPLGAGGMGEVYRARDRRLGRDVALKVLSDQVAKEPSRVDRLVREARLLASLTHPNIAVLYGLEEAAGKCALVMELVPGETLAQRLSRGPLGIRDALAVCRQAAAALEYAHRQGIVHRDLKPSNLMILPDGTVKVLDFGLARVFSPAAADAAASQSPTVASDRTHPGMVVGTVAYMSPEQARGRSVDRQADVWALGCVLYEALTAKAAFGGESPADTFAAILYLAPDWKALPAECPARVRELIRRCLEKKAEDRLHDIGDGRIEIEAILDTLSRPPSTVAVEPSRARLLRPMDRRQRLAVAAVGLAVAVGGLWLAVRRKPSRYEVPRDKVLVVLPFRVGDEAGRSVGEGLAESLAARLARDAELQVVAAENPSAQGGEPDFGRLSRKLGVNLLVRGLVQREGGKVRVTFSLVGLPAGLILTGDSLEGTPDELFALEDRVAERVRNALRLSGREGAHADERLLSAAAQDRYFAALGLLRRQDDDRSVSEAVRLLETIPDGERSTLVQAALARGYLFRYRLTRVRALADRALEASDRASRLDAGLPEVPLAAGEVLLATGQVDRAERSFRSALALRPSYVEAFLGLARTLDRAGRTAEAEAAQRRVVALRPSWPQGWVQLGNFHFRHGSFGAAEEDFREAAALDPDDGRIQSRLAGARYELGRFAEAVASAERSIALDPTAQAYSNYGTVLYALGRFADAGKAFERAVALTPGDGTYWVNLGDARRQAKDGAGAAEAYRNAAAVAEKEAAVNPKDDAAQMSLALAYGRLGENERARAFLRRALELAPLSPENLFQGAILEAAWGQRQEAIGLLERSVAAGKNPVTIGVEPDLAPLKDDPRVRTLTARTGAKGEGR